MFTVFQKSVLTYVFLYQPDSKRHLRTESESNKTKQKSVAQCVCAVVKGKTVGHVHLHCL